jgi:excinuclease ABC subunit C
MKEADIHIQVEALPQAPGVYLFKDQKGGILYVGKAKDLRKRVRTYVQGREQDIKTSIMLAKVGQIDHIATRTEKEALILEDTLIKEHHPRYNIQLRDDKRYPLLRLSIQERFPRLSVVRRTREDGALYFGPFPAATSMRETLRVIHKAFPLRRCSATQFAHRSRPCLNFQMNRCLAPCCNEVSEETYNRIVEEVRLFLEGKSNLLAEELRKRMDQEAAALRFEEAARIRDRLAALERIAPIETSSAWRDKGKRSAFRSSSSGTAGSWEAGSSASRMRGCLTRRLSPPSCINSIKKGSSSPRRSLFLFPWKTPLSWKRY